jgi:arsenate reductase (thioredoxin)
VLEKRFNVLFLCTGNSARSIIAEVLLNDLGRNRFRAYSAGSHPKGEVHPSAVEILRRNHYPTDGLRSKGWEEFARSDAHPDASDLDFVFTVCDKAAGEVCPVWPGQPMTAHWGIADPAEAQGDMAERAFRTALRELRNRILLFVSLPFDKLDRLSLQKRLDAIGQETKP